VVRKSLGRGGGENPGRVFGNPGSVLTHELRLTTYDLLLTTYDSRLLTSDCEEALKGVGIRKEYPINIFFLKMAQAKARI